MKLNRYRNRDVDDMNPVEEAGIRGGIHSKNTFLVQMRDGSEWFYKVGVGEERDELFAYELAALLFGGVVPEVRLADLGKGIGSIMRKVDGVQAKRVDGMHGYFHGNPNLLTDLANMVVMDFLTGNTDRHEGNWFLTDDGRIKAIDNGFVGYDPEIDFKRCLRPVRACGVYHDEELWPEFLLRLVETADEAAGRGKQVRELADRVGLQAREAVDLTSLWEAKMEGLTQAVRAELSKVGGVQKARRYLGEGEEAPEGVEVQEGPQGGRYYEMRGRKPAEEMDVITEVQRLRGFGKDWLTGKARDLIRVAVLAGFDREELVLRVARADTKGENTNSATVKRILGEMESEMDARQKTEEEAPAEEKPTEEKPRAKAAPKLTRANLHRVLEASDLPISEKYERDPKEKYRVQHLPGRPIRGPGLYAEKSSREGEFVIRLQQHYPHDEGLRQKAIERRTRILAKVKDVVTAAGYNAEENKEGNLSVSARVEKPQAKEQRGHNA